MQFLVHAGPGGDEKMQPILVLGVMLVCALVGIVIVWSIGTAPKRARRELMARAVKAGWQAGFEGENIKLAADWLIASAARRWHALRKECDSALQQFQDDLVDYADGSGGKSPAEVRDEIEAFDCLEECLAHAERWVVNLYALAKRAGLKVLPRWDAYLRVEVEPPSPDG